MKKKLIIGLLLATTFILGGISAYAYFTKVLSGQSTTVSPQIDEAVAPVIMIKDENQFYKEIDINQDEINGDFNSNSDTSKKRKTLKLEADLVLRSDALVTSDCHIDLNGKKIDLNGNKLNIKNSFLGTMSIYDSATNGVITDSKLEAGKFNTIIVDTPKMEVNINDTCLASTIGVKYINANSEMIINSAARFIYANITSGYMNDFYETLETPTAFSDNTNCDIDPSHTHNAASIGCVYTHDDLDLVYNYYSYPIKIEYLSSNEALVSKYGNVVPTGTTSTADLKVSLSYNNEPAVEKVITVHVVGEADYNKASNLVMLDYLKAYDNGTKMYEFKAPILLPTENSYFDTTYSYTVYDDAGKATQDNTKNDYFNKEQYPGYVLATITKAVKQLEVTSKALVGGAKAAIKINTLGSASSALDDDLSYCINIISTRYRNDFIVSVDALGINGYTTYDLFTDITEYTRLTNIEYRLNNNTNSTYNIGPNQRGQDGLSLYVNAGMTPQLNEGVTVSVIFSVDGRAAEDKIVIDIPIIFEVHDGGTPSINGFAPYYVYFDNHFRHQSRGYTYNNFEIPLFYSNEYPTYTFVIYEINPDGKTYSTVPIDSGIFNVTIKCTDRSVEPNVAVTGYMDLEKDKADFDKYRIDRSSTTLVTIDPYKVKKDTTTYFFAYVPIYSVVDNGKLARKYYIDMPGQAQTSIFNTYAEVYNAMQSLNLLEYKFKTKLTVPGLTRFNTTYNGTKYINEAFEDSNLYQEIYNELYPTEYASGKFIETDHLTQQIKGLDFSSANTQTYTSFKGLELLDGLMSLDFHGRNLYDMNVNKGSNQIEQLKHIYKMTHLKTLNLSETGIFDRQAGGLGFPGNKTNNLIDGFKTMTSLEVLDLSNNAGTLETAKNFNKIYDFKGLENIPSLKKVNLSNLKFKVTGSLGFKPIDDIIDPVITNLVNSLYGSSGGPNAAIIALIQSRGVEVINTGVTITISEELKRIVYALYSIEYQDRLKVNDDISKVYAHVLLTPENFNLVQEYYDTKGDIRVRNRFQSITILPDGDNVNTAAGFTLKIHYKAQAQRNGLFGWYDQETAKDLIYTYHYDVTRYESAAI